MKTETDSCNGHFSNGKNCLETMAIWEDAGFIPPKFYLHFTEFLHIMYLNEGRISVSLSERINDAVNRSEWNNQDTFEICDRNRLHRYADDQGIDVFNNDDIRLAAKITAGIISDYISESYIAFSATKTIIPDKNEIFSRYSSLKV